MIAIPIPTGCRGDSETPKQIESLVNCYYDGGDSGTLAPRPGIGAYSDGYGRCRGSGVFDSDLYQVSSGQLIKITESNTGIKTITLIGNISGDGDCILIPSFTKLLVMVKGGDAYVWDGVTLDIIDDPSYVISNDATFIFSRFVFIPADGGPYFWSELNDPSNIQPESFADAETLPDKNYSIIEYKDSLIIGGGETIERHNYNTPLATFQRVQSSTKNHGVVTSFARFGEDLMYIGKFPNGNMSFYSYNNGVIENKFVDEILNLYTINEIRGIHIDSFSWFSTNFVVWHLPNHTILFYGDFSIIKSGVSGDVSGTWSAEFISSYNGKLICGDRQQGRIGQLLPINSDYGDVVESEVITFLREQPRSNYTINRIFLQCTTGLDISDRKIGLSVSEDGVHYGPVIYIPIGKRGVFNNEISWGPIGTFDNHCSAKLRWVGQIRLPVDGVAYE